MNLEVKNGKGQRDEEYPGEASEGADNLLNICDLFHVAISPKDI